MNKLFCNFRDFYASGMQDAEVKKPLNIISFREGGLTAVSEILCNTDKIKINLA